MRHNVSQIVSLRALFATSAAARLVPHSLFRPTLIERRTLGEALRRRLDLAVAPRFPPQLILVRAVVLVLGDSEALDLRRNLSVDVLQDILVTLARHNRPNDLLQKLRVLDIRKTIKRIISYPPSICS